MRKQRWVVENGKKPIGLGKQEKKLVGERKSKTVCERKQRERKIVRQCVRRERERDGNREGTKRRHLDARRQIPIPVSPFTHQLFSDDVYHPSYFLLGTFCYPSPPSPPFLSILSISPSHFKCPGRDLPSLQNVYLYIW